MTATLELVGVHKSFGVTPIIRGVDLAIEKGERHAIIGPNGAGKSTLCKGIAGLVKPLAGRIVRAGLKPAHIAYLPQVQEQRLFKVAPGEPDPGLEVQPACIGLPAR